jgi:hypothetical protein
VTSPTRDTSIINAGIGILKQRDKDILTVNPGVGSVEDIPLGAASVVRRERRARHHDRSDRRRQRMERKRRKRERQQMYDGINKRNDNPNNEHHNNDNDNTNIPLMAGDHARRDNNNNKNGNENGNDDTDGTDNVDDDDDDDVTLNGIIDDDDNDDNDGDADFAPSTTNDANNNNKEGTIPSMASVNGNGMTPPAGQMADLNAAPATVNADNDDNDMEHDYDDIEANRHRLVGMAGISDMFAADELFHLNITTRGRTPPLV